VCNGVGCKECNGIGRFRLLQCPKELIDGATMDIIQMAELYEKGLPPVAGGQLDQAKSFVDAAYFIFNEIRYWKNKMGFVNGF